MKELQRALLDLTDGLSEFDIVNITGMPIDRALQILTLVDKIRKEYERIY
jgi:pilus assembly protein TadC